MRVKVLLVDDPNEHWNLMLSCVIILIINIYLIVQDLRVLGLDGVLISTFLSKLLELHVFFRVNCVQEHFQKTEIMEGNIECFLWQTSTKL